MYPLALTEMVDRVIDDRYRIERLIGVGPVSAVYSANDLVDSRHVALKVFDAAIAADEAYVERLLDAVEQAALLAHPNIVEIYDWGVDGGPYVVSELCEGGSLAALLEAGHVLAPSQALVMSLECARALNFGHEQGAIHRHVTTANVLFTDDQRVRMSDFGLSVVVADAPVSQAARSLENVRYASPEQARGRPITEATDLYSLALLVNEAVSGRPPSVADTVVGTLMERAESAALLDASLEELLPPFERCGRVDPQQRPEAEELAIALLASAETMARPEAFPLVGIQALSVPADSALRVTGGSAPDPEFAASGAAQEDVEPAHGTDDDDDDEFDISRLGSLEETDDFAADSPEPEDTPGPTFTLVPDTAATLSLENLEQAEPVFASVPEVDVVDHELDVPAQTPSRRAAASAYEEVADDVDDRLPWWPLAALGLLIAGLVAAGVYFLVLSGSAESAQVPDLIGVSIEELEGEIADRGWEVERLESRIDGSVAGSILAQSPAPGTQLDEGETLTVTVSLGNQMVEIPSDIIGYTLDQAASRLGDVGLTIGQLSEENNEALGAGLVIGLDEPTTQKPSGESVDLRISLGAEDRVVPATLVGMTIGDATSVLAGLRLQAVEESAFSPDIEVGTVLSSVPPGSAVVAADSAVTLVVSAGPAPVEVPEIAGLSLSEAVDAIEEVGLVWVDEVGTPGEDVIGSVPQPGEIVDVGTEVVIVLADPEDDEEG